MGSLGKFFNARRQQRLAQLDETDASGDSLPPTLTPFQQRLWEELDYLELSAGYSFLGHLNDHKHDDRVHFVVGLTATAATTVGAAGILTEYWSVVAGLVALIGALLTGVMTFMKKSEYAAKSLSAAHGCARVEARFRQTKNLKVGTISDGEVVQIIEDLTAEYNEANGAAGAIRKKSYAAAKKSFRSGERAGRTENERGAS